ncbi:hypothetical protein E1211_24815 [Micromonospora sp. 15K316]|uniref:hypothetical protein n=1 Tax=Micromonospora sp. 15K316 TaxID=2530376 RepID=UPI001050BB93|nr:hypothetical protein [Micromonospora sp. 15K316]TDC30072.1 hypothetical protein E1211_24815 [Micromonospora sp. 15K316]
MALHVDRSVFDYYLSTLPAPERAVWLSRERDRECIAAMRNRIERNPVRGVLWRRPWRSRTRPNWRSPRGVLAWLRAAHDCSDPAVACSCDGGYRFPRPVTGVTR